MLPLRRDQHWSEAPQQRKPCYRMRVCLQTAGPNAASKAEPTKRAQQIQPVLRAAPTRKSSHVSNAAAYGTAHSHAAASDQHARSQPASSAAGARAQHSTQNAQEALYLQQIQTALREQSPEAQNAAPQKRSTAKLPVRKSKAVSPAQQAQQDLTDR